MLHYRCWFECMDDDQMSYSMLLHGETEEEIQAQVDEMIEDEKQESGREYKAQREPMTTEELIAEKEDELIRRVKFEYLNAVTSDGITIREYHRLQRNPDTRWKAVDYFEEKIRVEKIVQGSANLDKLTVRLYNEYVKRLMDAKTMTEYKSIVEEIKKI